MSLFASLPFRDRLEGLDVPPNELSQCRCTVFCALQSGWVFELDLPMFRPRQSRRARGERLALLMQNGDATPNADDRCVADRTVCLLAGFDGCHGVT
jgi:hypothetical protein